MNGEIARQSRQENPMNKIILLIFLQMPIYAPICAIASQEDDIGLTAHNIFDNRISLGLSTKVQHRLLVNMRAQFKATQAIIGLLAREKFESASKIAHTRLGLTNEMRQIYDLSKNEDFRNLGLASHKSAAELETALQTKDMKKSLQALRDTMGYCVQCHSKFRQ
jgi:Cytochrome C'